MATSAVTKKSRRTTFKPLTAEQATRRLNAVVAAVQQAKQIIATAEPEIGYLNAVIKAYNQSQVN